MLRQERHVVETLPQRRHVDPQHLEPVKEVGAEAAGLHGLFQRHVRGRQHAHVHFDLPLSAHPLDDALFQHPQEFCLQAQRNLADFVEEQRALMGAFKPPPGARARRW